jgi:hypothetical protein
MKMNNNNKTLWNLIKALMGYSAAQLANGTPSDKV